MKIKFLNIMSILFFIFTMACSFLYIMYYLQYDLLIRHDQTLCFNRTFLSPEHGRYVSTFLSELLIEKLPRFFKIHTNDFESVAVAPFKSILAILICLFLTHCAFLFKEDENYSNEQYGVFSFKPLINNMFKPAFVICYILIFALIMRFETEYLSLIETMVFFEYPLSMIYFISFFSSITYIFVTDKKLNKKTAVILALATFLLGISVEIYNCPTFFGFSLVILFILLKKQSFQKANLKFFMVLYITYLFSLLVYYISPNDVDFNYEGSFVDYIHSNLLDFIKYFYYIFYYKVRIFIYSILGLILLILLFNRSQKENNKKFIYIILANIFVFMLYFLSSFLFGFCESNHFYFFDIKWQICFYLVNMLFFILSVSYFLDTNKKLKSKSDIIKIIMCVIILALFHKILIVQAIKDIKTEHNQIKELKENIYRTEKWAINSNSEYVYMPLSYKRLCIIYDTCYIEYFNNANSKLSNKKDVIFTDDYDYENIFAEEEIEKLHFTNLL